MNVQISEKQATVLSKIVLGGKVNHTDVDGRVVRALASRGLVKVTETKKGTFISPTAKGKKLN